MAELSVANSVRKLPSVISKAKGLVDPLELSKMMQRKDVVVIDVSLVDQFEGSHIKAKYPGQVVNGVDFWSYRLFEDTGGFEGMKNHFAQYLGSLGVTGNETLVFTEQNSTDGLGRSFRAEFMLKSLGYDASKLCILDGGNENWQYYGNDLVEGSVSIVAKPAVHGLEPQMDLLVSKKEVVEFAIYGRSGTVVLDVRDFEEWTGERSSPGNLDKEISAGRIPGSHNLSWGDFFKAGDKLDDSKLEIPLVLKNSDEMKALVADLKLDLDTPVILYCYKGSRASLVHKALTDVLGFNDVKVYFESWAGYARDGSTPKESAQHLPSSTRTHGFETSGFLKIMHRKTTPSVDAPMIVPEGLENPFQAFDTELAKELSQKHQWLVEPLSRASNWVLKTPFYRWVESINSPQDFLPVGIQLWKHSTAFPQAMGEIVSRTSSEYSQDLVQFASGYAAEKLTHNKLLLDWMVKNNLVEDRADILGKAVHLPETDACIDMAYEIANSADVDRWLVAINCAMEKCSLDLLKVLARKTRELGVGDSYFDLNAETNQSHHVTGLEHIDLQSLDTSKGEKLILAALEGVQRWTVMLNSYVGVDCSPTFNLDGRIDKRKGLIAPSVWITSDSEADSNK